MLLLIDVLNLGAANIIMGLIIVLVVQRNV